MKAIYLLLKILVSISNIAYAQIYINEIMLDPTPHRGLPIKTEYIEIYNSSSLPFEANKLTLKDAKGSTSLPDFVIPANGYALLIPKNAVLKNDLINKKTKNIIVRITKWLSLNNDKEIITITNEAAKAIDSYTFNLDDWQDNTDFTTGGISLERVEINDELIQSCNPRKFTPSISALGGSPLERNSIKSAVEYEFLYNIENDKISIYLPNQSIAKINAITIKTIVDNQNDNILVPEYQYVTFYINNNKAIINIENFIVGKKYTLNVNNVTLCNGTLIEDYDINIVLPLKELVKNSLVITKIMYDPLSERPEFIELTNPIQYYISLIDIELQRLSDDNTIIINGISLENNASIEIYSKPGKKIKYMPPFKSWVLTTKPELLKQQYPSLNGDDILVCKSSCITLPNQGGVIKVVQKNTVIDEVTYSDKHHSPFLKVTKGIFLTRKSVTSSQFISANGTQLGNQNNTFFDSKNDEQTDEDIVITPKLLDYSESPYNKLEIKVPIIEDNALVTIKICDKKGYPLVTLAENEVNIGQSSWYFNPYTGNSIAWYSGRYFAVIRIVFPENGIEKLLRDTFVLYFN